VNVPGGGTLLHSRITQSGAPLDDGDSEGDDGDGDDDDDDGDDSTGGVCALESTAIPASTTASTAPQRAAFDITPRP
jgi:hypothetical protein